MRDQEEYHPKDWRSGRIPYKDEGSGTIPPKRLEIRKSTT